MSDTWGTKEDNNEDEENNFNEIQSAEVIDDTPTEISHQCNCAVENSLRFSLRVMEAMRLLQREDDQPVVSSAEDIVDYIKANYHNDGDLYAQVRTSLRQICSQGFIIEILDNQYHLVGPTASWRDPDLCTFDCEGHKPLASSRRNGPSREVLEKTLLAEILRDPATDTADEKELLENDDYQQSNARPPRTRLRAPSPIPVTNTKRVRLERDDEAEREAEHDAESTTTEEDVEYATQDALRDRARDVTIEIDERDEHDDDEDVDVDAEDVDEEDEDTEDSAYRDLRERNGRRRPRARERELKRWIRRCREECERRAR